MKVVVASPSTAPFAQQAALAFYEHDALQCLFTTFAYTDDGLLSRIVSRVPKQLRVKVTHELARRAVTGIPSRRIKTWPFWEVFRTCAAKAGASAPAVDIIWDRLSHKYTRLAAKLLSEHANAIYAYEYTALEAFRESTDLGVARIIDFPSLNSRQYDELQRMEKRLFPDLAGPHEKYFERKFKRRQARRDAELELADVIITNSSLSRNSHIQAGADATKIFAVPYGAPPVTNRLYQPNRKLPLRIVWAGTFSLRKGAHYFLEAWRGLKAGGAAQTTVYGSVAIPPRLLASECENITFCGSVTRPVLFDAFDNSDVLVFPTLSDGFGMVVTEALARGLPVITTDQAGASDLVEHKRNGLIIPAASSGALKCALTWCLDNRDQLADMRLAAADTARRWQWSDYRRALIDAVNIGLCRSGYNQLVS